MRIAFVHPGLHRVCRGSEVAFEAIAWQLASSYDVDVTLFGSGEAIDGTPYAFRHIDNSPREKFEKYWPKFPIFRSNYIYEEFSFVWNLISAYDPDEFDVTVACSYPFLNWFLRWRRSDNRPSHIFVTQNGDHPAIARKSEYQFFACDGLICTNPEYFENNKDDWNCTIVTNGVDPSRFYPGEADRSQFDLPDTVPIALIVSALIPSKRIAEGIKAAAEINGLHLLVCGDGPERDTLFSLGQKLMGDRFHLKQLPFEKMPEIYRVADVLVHLSLDEPFGNIYLEALASGLPIVAHDRKVTRWIVENNAFFIDSTQTDSIIQGISSALELDSEAQMAARLELVHRRFTWSVIAAQYYDFLSQVLTNIKAA